MGNVFICRSQEKQITEQRDLLTKTKDDVDQAKKRLEEVTIEIDRINQQLNEANVDTHESSRMQKKQELVESLKRVCTGTVVSLLSIDDSSSFFKGFEIIVLVRPFGRFMSTGS